MKGIEPLNPKPYLNPNPHPYTHMALRPKAYVELKEACHVGEVGVADEERTWASIIMSVEFRDLGFRARGSGVGVPKP